MQPKVYNGFVLLDAGHGYNTAGKRSPVWSDGTQLFEWEFNRDIVRRIQRRLISLGIPSKILVKEARDISLKTRVGRANDIYKEHPDAFLVSVHGNAGGGEGWEVWTSPGDTESDKIATIFFASAEKWLSAFRMRSDHSDGDPDKESKFYILVRTDCPAILTENLFYDNELECQYMMTDYGREQIAKLHVNAIVDYLNSRK